MTELKCPFCQQELQYDYDDLLCSCINEYCEESFDMVGTELLWQKVIDLKQDIDSTRKALEQSEICCTEWEKQALDYKAENIALSGDLERTHRALDVAVDALKELRPTEKKSCYLVPTVSTTQRIIDEALEQITALEQKE